MSLMNYFRFPKKSARVAKDRLHIIIAQERGQQNRQQSTLDYLPLLRKELLDVISKYIKVDLNQVTVDFHHDGDNSVLELNVILPENEPVDA